MDFFFGKYKMTTTPFLFPSTRNQVQIFDSINQLNTIPWQNLENISDNSSYTSTVKPLYTISGLWMEKFLSKTNQLWLTGFNFPQASVVSSQVGTQITGIEPWDYHSGDYPYAWITNGNNAPIFSSLYSIGPSIVGWTFYSSDHPNNPVTITAWNPDNTGSSLNFSADPGPGPYTAHSPNYAPQVLATLTGIEFQLGILRSARIEDLLIQLTLNGELVGDNLASTVNPVESNMYTGEYMDSPVPPQPVGDYNIYGGPTNLWGTTLSSVDIINPTFGIVISFKSNEIYPHKDLCYVNQVALRATYA